jgi:hypothetical protein
MCVLSSLWFMTDSLSNQLDRYVMKRNDDALYSLYLNQHVLNIWDVLHKLYKTLRSIKLNHHIARDRFHLYQFSIPQKQ